MYISQKELNSLAATIDLIRDSDGSPHSRQRMSNQLMRLCGADYAASYEWNEHKQCFVDAVFENMDASNIKRYNQHYQHHDPITHKLRCFRRAVAVSEVLPHRLLMKTEFYNDFLQHDGLTYGMNLFVYNGSNQLFDFRLWRSNKKQDFKPRQLKMLDSILPYLKKMPQTNTNQTRKILPKFTPREYQVIELLQEGLPDKLIADSLNISITTLRTHLRKIYQTATVHSRTELLAKL